MSVLFAFLFSTKECHTLVLSVTDVVYAPCILNCISSIMIASFTLLLCLQ